MNVGGPVRFEVEGRVARITLDRPPLHILDVPTVEALGEAVARVTRTPGVVVTVLAATGDKAFSSGVNIADHMPDKAEAMLRRFHTVIRSLRALECVTVAAVRGVALGGGFELALACDMMVAEEGASFGAPEIWLACFPPVGAAALPRHLAPQKAAEIILSGEQITAEEAAAMGLVNLVVPRGGMEGALERYVSLFTEKSAAALRIAKRALRAGEERPFDAALAEAERLYVQELLKTEDAAEGIRAYLEKREPKWKDR
ncbi:MAG TPA: enoyl-CoA hydratase-related protein [Candidatus Eisenbacteria bacterium]